MSKNNWLRPIFISGLIFLAGISSA
ncbi:hypothetical protein MNBD_ALPHA11-1917, partial [hydrothermal vent metagenome]